MSATTPIERAVDHLEYCTSAAERSQLLTVEVDTKYLRALISERQALRTKLTAALQAISRISTSVDLIRYLPGVTEDGRLALWCTDCAENPGADNSDPFWTDADAAEQVTEVCLANLVAIAEEHEQKHHADSADSTESPR